MAAAGPASHAPAFTRGRSLFLYPRGTDRQLRRLLDWRARTGRLHLVAIALWVEGFPLRVGVVRRALHEFTSGWAASVEAMLAEQPADESAPDALARTLSRQRSRAPIPRLSRMRLVERERAYAYLVAVMLGFEAEAKARSEDLPHVQRLEPAPRSRAWDENASHPPRPRCRSVQAGREAAGRRCGLEERLPALAQVV